MKATIKMAFTLAGMPEDKADTCARIHTESSRDGVYSHGLNRVERFVEYIGKGWVDVHASPVLERDLGALEVYNGNLGPGITNAIFASTLDSTSNSVHGHESPREVSSLGDGCEEADSTFDEGDVRSRNDTIASDADPGAPNILKFDDSPVKPSVGSAIGAAALARGLRRPVAMRRTTSITVVSDNVMENHFKGGWGHS
jgi:hypothetical protein